MNSPIRWYPTYKYRSLRSNEFRVFVLQRGRPEDPIRGHLEHWNINAEYDRSYAALSYVWGDPTTNRRPIYLGWSVHWVTYNLWSFLKRLRPPPSETDDWVLWADAICINQLDDAEKSLQVQYMTRIYPRASAVVCWLGEEDSSVQEAFETLRQWAVVGEDEIRREQLLRMTYEQLERLAQKQEPRPRPLGSLFARPWFRRAWIMQEICVDDKQWATLLCGREEIPWAHVWMGFWVLGNVLGTTEILTLYGEAIEYLLPLIRLRGTQPEDMSLSCLLPQMRSREATKPQDMLYSLLGLAERFGHSYPAADYSLTVEQVSIKYTRAIIEAEERLDILSIVDFGRRDCGLPTWTLRLSSLRSAVYSVEHVIRPAAEDRYGLFNATLDLPPIMPKQDPFDRRLQIRGRAIGQIAALYSLDHFVNQQIGKETKTWSVLLSGCYDFSRLLDLPCEYPFTGESTMDALVRTLCMNASRLFWNTGRFGALRRALFNAYKHHMFGTVCSETNVSLGAHDSNMSKVELIDYVSRHFRLDGTIQSLCCNGHVCQHSRRAGVPHEFLEQSVLAMLIEEMKTCITDRVLAETQGGHLGLVSKECRVGDELCLLLGSTVPLVLRKVGCSGGTDGQECAHFFGDSYVHGVMDGEAMETFKSQVAARSLDSASQDLTLYCLV